MGSQNKIKDSFLGAFSMDVHSNIKNYSRMGEFYECAGVCFIYDWSYYGFFSIDYHKFLCADKKDALLFVEDFSRTYF